MDQANISISVLYSEFNRNVDTGEITIPDDGYVFAFVRGLEDNSAGFGKWKRIEGYHNGRKMDVVTEEPVWSTLDYGSVPLYGFRGNQSQQEAYVCMKVKKGDILSFIGKSTNDSGYCYAYAGAIVVFVEK